MHCYTHEHKTAAAACKSCGRAICRDCAKDLGFAVVCSERCEADASDMNEMNSRAKRLYGLGGAKKVFPITVLMWGLMGAIFAGFGVHKTVEAGRPEWFLLVFGAMFLLLAVVSFRRAKAMQLNC